MEEQDESRDWGIEVDAGQPHTQGVGSGVVLTSPGKCETQFPRDRVGREEGISGREGKRNGLRVRTGAEARRSCPRMRVELGCGSGPMVLPGNAGAEKAPNQGLGTLGTKRSFLCLFFIIAGLFVCF